ncbi:MAG TPA: LamG-like jellyroll fold domain-containing protein [Kofleriaceae bacterium]|nr:LamG-like jellyroll fold domain-containing protein [Kofleriaceae bacterium]
MVLIRAGLVLAALASAACSQSLFDNRGPDGPGGGPGSDAGGGDGGVTPSSCPAPCIADAAADFDGTTSGTTMRWRYVEDHRNRTWGLMTQSQASPPTLVGQTVLNSITTCKGNESSPACSKLSDALLISSAGATAAADPALEFTVPTAAVIQVALRVYVPSGPDQQIRLYRGSREDALFTGVATAGTVLDQAITLDALAGDRFLLAVAPTAAGATGIGVQLFAGPTGAVFPHDCQLALEFTGASGTTVKELCQGSSFESHHRDDMGTDTVKAIALAAGPYAEQRMGVNLSGGMYLQGMKVLDQLGDVTVQLWSLQNNQDTVDSVWPFSDLDLNVGGGLGLAVVPGAPPILDATSSIDPDPGVNTYFDVNSAFDAQGVWKFIRVVHAGATLNVCIDGKLTATMAVPVGQLKTTLPPYIGKNVIWNPQTPELDGVVDDVRVFSGALPCN